MFTERTPQGLILRVRLTPNSSSCLIKGIFMDANEKAFLKINVISVPEKGKANKELISYLAARLKIAKSNLEIISGELDRFKKILIKDDVEKIQQKIGLWFKEGEIDE